MTSGLLGVVARQHQVLVRTLNPGIACCSLLGNYGLAERLGQLSFNRAYHRGNYRLINCDSVKLIRKPTKSVAVEISAENTRAFRFWSSQNAQKKSKSDEEVLGKHDKVLKVKLKAQRLDAVLKAGLSLSRNKIEKAIYDDRVRVNGQRPEKKSQVVYEGDEIDIVRGYNDLNPENFIDVSRVEILELKDAEDDNDDDSDSDDDENDSKIPAVLRRSKMLTIKNYNPQPWKGSKDN